MIAYPEFLPEPQRDGYGFQPVSPMARSELQSGRARQRRRFTSVPTVASVTWLMDDTEAQLFEGWFEHILLSGSLWFQCPLKTPLGMDEHRARFVDIQSLDSQHWYHPGLGPIRRLPTSDQNAPGICVADPRH